MEDPRLLFMRELLQLCLKYNFSIADGSGGDGPVVYDEAHRDAPPEIWDLRVNLNGSGEAMGFWDGVNHTVKP